MCTPRLESFFCVVVLALFSCVVPTMAQDDEIVSPKCLAPAGMMHLGVSSVPYWVKNNSLNAPASVRGDMFVFDANTPTADMGNDTGSTVRYAIYLYAKGENDRRFRPIPARSDNDPERRYVSRKQGGGLMASLQVDEPTTVSLFVPHSAFDLAPGEYQIAYKVVAFYTENGKAMTEEYRISETFNVEVQRSPKGRRSETRIFSIDPISPSEDNMPFYFSYQLVPNKDLP